MEEYLLNNELKTINPNWKGNLNVKNRFVELRDCDKKNIPFIMKLMFKEAIYPLFGKGKFVKAESTDKLDFKKNKDFTVWLGHNSFFIKINGISIITDPFFYSNIFLRRKVKLPFNIKELGNIDYVLISHFHPDHICKKSLKNIVSKNTSILSGLKMDKNLKEYKDKIQTAGWYQKYNLDKDISIYFMPSRHNSGNKWSNLDTSLWGSFIIQSKEKTIFFTGDTGYDKHFKKIKEFFPNIDYLLMELSWSETTPTNGHLGPKHYQNLFDDLKPKKIIPMHFGTYKKCLYRNPIEDLENFMKKKNIYEKLNKLKIGESLVLK